MDAPLRIKEDQTSCVEVFPPVMHPSSTDEASSAQTEDRFASPAPAGPKPEQEVVVPEPTPQCSAACSPPAWVNLMLGASFFSPCDRHKHLKKNECTYFCATCSTMPTSLCQHCMHEHRGHQVIQIRRYVYCDVVRAVDITQHVDVNGVQAYIINQAKVVFLNPRPQAKIGLPTDPDSCRSCSRNLREGFSFCCVACKVDAMQKGLVDDLVPAGSGGLAMASGGGLQSSSAAMRPGFSGRGVGGSGAIRTPRPPASRPSAADLSHIHSNALFCALASTSSKGASDDDGSSCEADDVFVYPNSPGGSGHPSQMLGGGKRRRSVVRGGANKRWLGADRYSSLSLRVTGRESSCESGDGVATAAPPLKSHRRKQGTPCRSPH